MQRKSKIKLNIIVLLLSGIMFVVGSSITFSLFTSGSRFIANQKIAKFVFNAQKTDLIELPITNLNPGDKMEYTFQVANTLNSKRSEVTIDYQISIKTYHFMPLDIELFKIEDKQESKILTCNENYSRNIDNQLLCNGNIQTLNHDIDKLDEYKLKIKFPEIYNEEYYTELVDYIDIDISSWQATGGPIKDEG